MLFGDLAPLVRPLSRWLAAAGWCCTVVGLGTGLVVAVGTGVSLTPAMQVIQMAGLVATATAALLIGSAAAIQPVADQGRRPGTTVLPRGRSTEYAASCLVPS